MERSSSQSTNLLPFLFFYFFFLCCSWHERTQRLAATLLKRSVFVVVLLALACPWGSRGCWISGEVSLVWRRERESVRGRGHGLVVFLGDLEDVRDEKVHGCLHRDVFCGWSGKPADEAMVLAVRVELIPLNFAIWAVTLNGFDLIWWKCGLGNFKGVKKDQLCLPGRCRVLAAGCWGQPCCQDHLSTWARRQRWQVWWSQTPQRRQLHTCSTRGSCTQSAHVQQCPCHQKEEEKRSNVAGERNFENRRMTNEWMNQARITDHNCRFTRVEESQFRALTAKSTPMVSL